MSLIQFTGAGEHQRRLLKYLLEESKHNPLERPVLNDTRSLTVSMNLALQQIIDFVRLKCLFHIVISIIY